jgi:hypothetical protein
MSSKLGVYKFPIFSGTLVLSFKPPISEFTNRERVNHAELSSDAQEQATQSYALEFTTN